MSGRQVFLLAQAVGLLLAIFVAPGFVQGCAKKVSNLSAAGIADQALGGGPALTDLERKAKAEEAFLAYYLAESRTSAVSNPDVELRRRRDIACGGYFADADEDERRLGRACLETDRRTGHARGAYLVNRRGAVTACTRHPPVVGPRCPRGAPHDVRERVVETCVRSERRERDLFGGERDTYAEAIEKCAS